jgi:alkanesulfonate monooxygenase SsuD/methylene tetrahydromethanopterin reductase-like flavin-dependent oxidoreductase (luciferase family)
MAVQLGWKAGAEQYPPVELLEYAVAAEDAGFDSIDVSDHFHPWSEKGQACFVWSWLGAVRATKHMSLFQQPATEDLHTRESNRAASRCDLGR